MESPQLDPAAIDRLDLDAVTRAHLLELIEGGSAFHGDCPMCAELRQRLDAVGGG